MKEIKKSNLYQIVLFCYVFVIITLVERLILTNFPLIRYFGSLLIFYKIIMEIKNNPNSELLNRNLLLFFMSWVIFIVMRNINDIFSSAGNYMSIKRFLSEELILYSFPLLIFAKIELAEIKKIFKLHLKFSLFYFIISVLFFNYFTNMTAEEIDFGIGAEVLIIFFPSSLIILLFTSNYHSTRVNVSTIFIIIFATFLSVLLARRNKVLYFGSALLMAGYLVSVSNTILSKKYRFTNSILIMTVSLSLFIFYFINIEKFSFFLERAETGIESREEVIDEFFSDFDNHPSDWLWGRGFHGAFISRSLSLSDTDNTRDLIENGYLHAILKGGLLYLILLFIIILLSFYQGFIRSKNLLSKGMAFILILYLVDLIGYGLPTVGFKYMVIFIAIAVCNSFQINKMTDLEILQKIQLK